MNKELDQHFLENKEILEEEANQVNNLNDAEYVLEIGAGDGRLSRKILEKNKDKILIAIEKDSQYEEKLEATSKEFRNFKYYISDWRDHIEDENIDMVMGNIPYSITEPLYYKILDYNINHALLLHGSKFFKLLKNSNKLSYFVNSIYEIELIRYVEGDEFFPVANTRSVLVKLNRKNPQSLPVKEKIFSYLAYKRKRKTSNALVYSLKDTFSISKKEANSYVENSNISQNILEKTIDSLSNEEFKYIIEFVEKLVR